MECIMSRTILSPKTGKLLSGFPNNSYWPNILGDILSRKGLPVYRAGYTGAEKLLPWQGNAAYCQIVGKTLLNLTTKEIASHFKRNRFAYSEDMTLDEVRQKLRDVGFYFLRLKHGYIDVNSMSTTSQGTFHFPVDPKLLVPQTTDGRRKR